MAISGGFTLKTVRRLTWEARSKWRQLGIELDVKLDTIQVSITWYVCLQCYIDGVQHQLSQVLVYMLFYLFYRKIEVKQS